MAEPSRRVKRVHGGLLPSGYPAGFGRDQSGFAALSRGFSAVATAADQIRQLRDASDRTRVQTEINQAKRDEADERRQGIADGSIDPAQFEAGDDLDFYTDDRIANLESKFADIQSKTGSAFDREKLDLIKQDAVGALKSELQIQQVAALATRVAHDQTLAANAIGADVGTGVTSFDVGLVLLSDLMEAAPLSAERQRELDVKLTTGLVLGGVQGAINRAEFNDAIDMIDHPKTVDTMSSTARENLRAKVKSRRQTYLGIASGKAHTANALYVDSMKRDIALNELGPPVTEYDVLNDPRLAEDPGSQIELVKAVRDRNALDVDRARRLHLLATNPFALSQDERTSTGRDLQARMTNELIASGMPPDNAAMLSEHDFLAEFRFASQQMKGRLKNWEAHPTGENYDNLIRGVARIKQINASSLTADVGMAEVNAKAKMLSDLHAIGMSTEDVANLEIAARDMTADQKDNLAVQRKDISSADILAEMDTRLGESIWNLYGYFREDPPPEFQAATITLFDKFFRIGGGDREYAFAATEAARSGRWAPTSVGGFGSDSHYQQFPPETAVMDFEKAGGNWYYASLEEKLIEDEHISGSSGMRNVRLFSDPLTHQLMLAGETPTYLIELDGEPILDKDTGKPARWGDEWKDQPGYALQVQRAEMLRDREVIHGIEKEAAVKGEPLSGDPAEFKKRSALEKMAVGAAADAKSAALGYIQDVLKTGGLTEGARQYDIISDARRRTEDIQYKELRRRHFEIAEADKLLAEIHKRSQGAE